MNPETPEAGSQRTTPIQLKLSRRRSTSTSEEEPDIDEADEERLQHTELYYIDGVHAICVGYL